VRQSPSTIRVTAELVDGRTGLDRWSQDYDRSPGDAIKIQTDIAENVATALSAALGRIARATVGVGGTQNPEAQRLFIQAGAVAKASTSKADDEKAMQLLDQAIAIDPRYAEAYARKSIVLGGYANNYANLQELPKARAESLRLANLALSIAPNLASGHRALSGVYANLQQIGPSSTELKRARQLAPSDPDVLADLANISVAMGDTQTALARSDEAISLDPLNPHPFGIHLDALFYARRYTDAVGYGRLYQTKFGQKKLGVMVIGDSFLLLGRPQEAEQAYALAAPNYWRRLTGEAILRSRARDMAGAQQKIDELRAEYGDAASTQFGEIYAQIGDKDRAFAALDRAYEIKDAGLLSMKVDPFLDPLRSDPRFAALLRKLFPSG
jgi:tetratricopeptide (TPR) repeat protein